MTKQLKQQLFVAFFGAFSSVLLVSIVAVIAWYSVVNTELALTNKGLSDLTNQVGALVIKFESANLGGLKVTVENHEYRLKKVEDKLDNL